MDQFAYAAAILENIEQGGLYRYDSNDLDRYYTQKNGVFKNGWERKALRVLDILFPLATRKALRCEKTINATTFYHLGMALLCREKNSLPAETPLRAMEYGDMAVEAFYQPDSGLWIDPNGWISPEKSSIVEKAGPKSMAMHCLARLNILLLALWREYRREDFLDIAVNSCAAVIHHHNIRRYPGGGASISYYYNTTENTLNVNAEFLQWLADIPKERRPTKAVELGHQILQMLLAEQNEDGSFYYQAKCAAAPGVRSLGGIDAHHSAYMLNNLVHIMESDFPSEEERLALKSCCVRGMDFFLSRLYEERTGHAFYAINTPRHKADTMSYSEGLIAFCSYLRNETLPSELRNRVRRLAPLALDNMLGLIDLKTGATPSEIVFGKRLCINSIRWGNGPALQAIFDFSAAEQEGLFYAGGAQ